MSLGIARIRQSVKLKAGKVSNTGIKIIAVNSPDPDELVPAYFLR
jgi:hypothetical protein